MFTFLHTYLPSPIILSAWHITIRWYGLFIGIAVLASIGVAIKIGKRYGIRKNAVIDISFWLVAWGILGARLYHVLNELPFYLSRPAAIFKIWEGGLAIHGAIIAGTIVILKAAKRLKKGEAHTTDTRTALTLLDVFTPALLLGQALGRLGNYFNQELFGAPSSLPWSIPIAMEHRPPGFENFSHFHPTFLYESLWDLSGFLLLIILLKRSKNNSLFQKKGAVAASYLIIYSLGRTLTEFLRIDRTPHIFGVRLPMIVSIVCIASGLIFLAIIKITKKSTQLLQDVAN